MSITTIINEITNQLQLAMETTPNISTWEYIEKLFDQLKELIYLDIRAETFEQDVKRLDDLEDWYNELFLADTQKFLSFNNKNHGETRERKEV